MGDTSRCAKDDHCPTAKSDKIDRFEQVLEQPPYQSAPWILANKLARHFLNRWRNIKVKCEGMTKDNVSLKFSVYVKYRAMGKTTTHVLNRFSDIKTQRLAEPYVSDVIKAETSKFSLVEVYKPINRSGINKAVKDKLIKDISGYGIEIGPTTSKIIVPYPHWKTAMDEINAAGEMRVTKRLKVKVKLRLRKKHKSNKKKGLIFSGREYLDVEELKRKSRA